MHPRFTFRNTKSTHNDIVVWRSVSVHIRAFPFPSSPRLTLHPPVFHSHLTCFKMPFLAQEHLPIPTKDIISWCYDNRGSFDQNKPVPHSLNTRNRKYFSNSSIDLHRLHKPIPLHLRKSSIHPHPQARSWFPSSRPEKGRCSVHTLVQQCIHPVPPSNVRSVTDINKVYYPILVQGIVASGGIFVGTNPSYTPFELKHALETSKAKLVITEPDILKAPRETALKLGIPKERILLLAEPDEATKSDHASWRTLLEHGEQDWIRFDDLETAKNTPAFLMFSSGTTGTPHIRQPIPLEARHSNSLSPRTQASPKQQSNPTTTS